MDLPRYNRKGKMVANDPTKHYPNKDEAKLLRKIMSDTGLSEEEVRAIKKYRVMLSEAQKEGHKQDYRDFNRYYRKQIKKACQETGLAKEHPDTIAALQKIFDDDYSNAWRRPYWLRGIPSAKQIISNYEKNK